MLKVLFIQHGLGYGGATKSLCLVQKSISSQLELHTITQTVSRKNKELVSLLEKHSITTELSFPSIKSSASGTISRKDFENAKRFYPEKIIEYILNQKINVVHINSSLFSHLIRPIKEQTKAKVLVHLREMLPVDDTDISRYIVFNHSSYADLIVSISENELTYYPKTAKCLILPNPHDFTDTEPLLISRLKNDSQQNIIIGMCANFTPIKGHLAFLRTAEMICSEGYKNHTLFKIIGYPKKTKTLKEFVKKILKYGYRHRFDSAAKNANLPNLNITPFTYDIYDALLGFDIYVRPDLSGHPWGRDVIEAMALKKPVIATGTSEFFVENGVTGFLVPPNDPQKMAEKIIHLIKNPELREKMGEAGYEKVKSMCDLSEYGKKLLQIYKDLM